MTPADLEAAFDRVVELVQSWQHADDWADNAPASERDDARGVADEAKDEVLAFLSHLLAATNPEHAALTRSTGAVVTERQRCICPPDVCLDHCRACNHSGRDLEEPCIADPDWRPDVDERPDGGDRG